jgi:uncharacterized protein YegL
MPNFKEYPRGGSANGEIVNPQEIHLPCVIVVDTSGSMSSAMQQLHEGLSALGEAIKDDPQAVGRVEFCIIAFDDKARIVHPFTSAYDFEAPQLDCGGMTSTHEAIDLALSELNARKAQYKAEQTPYYRPWIYLLSDGGSNDTDNGAFQRLLEAQRNKGCVFFPVGIGSQINREELKSLREDGLIFTATKEDFAGAFTWLSSSLPVVATSQPGQQVALPEPGKHQLVIDV